jgi:DNA-binding YbaB/EbfC family protein
MNIQKLMRQAQQMQERVQREMGELVVEASAGGGMVTVRMNGHKLVTGVVIDPEVVDPADPQLLADLVLAAVNEAGRKVDETLQSRLGAMTGGGLPGLPGFGG